MKIKMIGSAAELRSVEPFYVEHLLWGTKSIPKTYGYIGFVPDEGFYLKMICEEQSPLRTYIHNQDPVYKDSTMEAFFMFEPERESTGLPVYFNLEMNSNGALLAAYGQDRAHRISFSEEGCRRVGCRAQINEKSWEVDFQVPIALLNEMYGPLHLGEGSTFSCNFYKISETKEIEHYASYSPVLSETPDFHLPEYFEKAIIVRAE